MDLRINSPDVTAIQVWGDFGTIRMFNIYNDCEHSDGIAILSRWYRNPEAASSPLTPIWTPQQPEHAIRLGDFD
jgi:hypothetical protein